MTGVFLTTYDAATTILAFLSPRFASIGERETETKRVRTLLRLGRNTQKSKPGGESIDTQPGASYNPVALSYDTLYYFVVVVMIAITRTWNKRAPWLLTNDTVHVVPIR